MTAIQTVLGVRVVPQGGLPTYFHHFTGFITGQTVMTKYSLPLIN